MDGFHFNVGILGVLFDYLTCCWRCCCVSVAAAYVVVVVSCIIAYFKSMECRKVVINAELCAFAVPNQVKIKKLKQKSVVIKSQLHQQQKKHNKTILWFIFVGL